MPLAREVLERLIEASPDIVVATDADGMVAFYNDGARENLGYTRQEIIGREVQALYPSLEEARRVMQAMRDSTPGPGGQVTSFPTTFVTKDGKELPIAISGVIVCDEAGEEQGTIGFAKDLSEIIRKDQLAVLGEVAIGLSHEINNPLTAIANYVALLERYLFKYESSPGAADELRRVAGIRSEIRRIEVNLTRLREMAEKEEYSSTDYLGEARMIDLSGADQGPLEGARLLVVDDDPAVRDSVAQLLRAEGCQVDVCENGRAALDRLESARYDLVLSDVVMPEMDGYELLLAVRQNHPQTKMVLMTAFYHDKDHIIKRSRLEGVEGVLFKKPLDPERLRKKLAELLTQDPQAPSGH
jgi:PAS domain S-box-containing protein